MRDPRDDGRDDRDGGDDYLWDGKRPRDPEVERLEGLLAPLRYDQPAPPAPAPARRRVWWLSFGLAGTLAAAAALLVAGRDDAHRNPAGPLPAVAAWQVENLEGAPRCGDDVVTGALPGELRPGEWLVTDEASRARVAVADIGHVEVAPGSRLRLVETGASGHRLELRVGTIEAMVTAPPRLLIVDTPQVRAVDLGCAYRLTVDAEGATSLEVTSGWVALEAPGRDVPGRDGTWREVYVPAGAAARTRKGAGPGTPLFQDAPADLRAAVERLDATAGTDEDALVAVLCLTRPRDTLTLWHLVPLVPAGGPRERIVRRLALLGSPPPGGDPVPVMALDRDALEAWRLDLAKTW